MTMISAATPSITATKTDPGDKRDDALALAGPEIAMNIHEYQAKELLAKFGVAVPKPALPPMTVDEAVAAAGKLPGPLYVVKAQIHAGGRGKGKFKELGPDAKGGVRLAKTLEEVKPSATDMLGNTLVTIQTGPKLASR
jgi:succinyl-CoA synthetase beta subunit